MLIAFVFMALMDGSGRGWGGGHCPYFRLVMLSMQSSSYNNSSQGLTAGIDYTPDVQMRMKRIAAGKSFRIRPNSGHSDC